MKNDGRNKMLMYMSKGHAELKCISCLASDTYDRTKDI